MFEGGGEEVCGVEDVGVVRGEAEIVVTADVELGDEVRGVNGMIVWGRLCGMVEEKGQKGLEMGNGVSVMHGGPYGRRGGCTDWTVECFCLVVDRGGEYRSVFCIGVVGCPLL